TLPNVGAAYRDAFLGWARLGLVALAVGPGISSIASAQDGAAVAPEVPAGSPPRHPSVATGEPRQTPNETVEVDLATGVLIQAVPFDVPFLVKGTTGKALPNELSCVR